MSATQIINGMSSGEAAALPRIYAPQRDPADGAMPMIIIAGTRCRVAWGTGCPLPTAAHA